MSVTITTLERGVRSMARKLEAMGLRCKVDVFRSGRGGDPLIAEASHVELEVVGAFKDADGDDDEASSCVKFTMGYGARGTIDENYGTWGRMREAGEKRILDDLCAGGWKQQVPVTVRVSRRTSDYHACIEGRPELWGRGPDQESAARDLVLKHQAHTAGGVGEVMLVRKVRPERSMDRGPNDGSTEGRGRHA